LNTSAIAKAPVYSSNGGGMHYFSSTCKNTFFLHAIINSDFP
jgi:hypothetical protein